MHNSVVTVNRYDLAEVEVDEKYFIAQNGRFEEKYRQEFPFGWGQFYAAYQDEKTDRCNLDFDEWAFICDHVMFDSENPPDSRTNVCNDKPESNSGFSISGANVCSIRIPTLMRSTGRLAIAGRGQSSPMHRFREYSGIATKGGKLYFGGLKSSSSRVRS